MSSAPFGRAFVLHHEQSRLAWIAWFAQQVTLAATWGAVDGPVYVKFAAAMALCVFACAVRPRGVHRLIFRVDGICLMATRADVCWKLAPASRYTRYWASLRLCSPGGRRRQITIWSDELAPADWRRLQILLREGGGPASTTFGSQ